MHEPAPGPRNVWGTLKSDIDAENFCVECEREGGGFSHYTNCPLYRPTPFLLTAADAPGMTKHRDTGNPARVRAAAERRRSNAAGIHRDRRTRRNRSRAAQRKRALDDQT